jgi:hypothetical protein
MEGLEPMDFFSETDRRAVVGQLKMREAASRNIADYYRAMRRVLESNSGDPDTDRRLDELARGIANAEAKAEETANEIRSWESA